MARRHIVGVEWTVMTDAFQQSIPKKFRSKLTNRPLAAIDRHTARGRRVGDLAMRLLADVGNDDAAVVDACIGLAELIFTAEQARRADTPDLNQIVRLEGLIDRRRRKLLAEHKPRPKLPTLASLMGAS
jgi:hypothetical protein